MIFLITYITDGNAAKATAIYECRNIILAYYNKKNTNKNINVDKKIPNHEVSTSIPMYSRDGFIDYT